LRPVVVGESSAPSRPLAAVVGVLVEGRSPSLGSASAVQRLSFGLSSVRISAGPCRAIAIEDRRYRYQDPGCDEARRRQCPSLSEFGLVAVRQPVTSMAIASWGVAPSFSSADP
jgi:hypothetical protein